MGNTKKLKLAVLGVAAAALMASVAASPVGAKRANPPGPNPDSNGTGPHQLIELQILSFNDYHGHVDPPAELLTPVQDPSRTPLGGAESTSSSPGTPTSRTSARSRIRQATRDT